MSKVVPKTKLIPNCGGAPRNGRGKVNAHIVSGTIPLMTRLNAMFPAFPIRFSAEILNIRLTSTYMTGRNGAPEQLLPHAGVRPLKHSHPIDK